MTDADRVLDWFRRHPGSSRAEAQQALGWIHVTARMSDLRERGYTFDKWRDPDNHKVTRFRVVDPAPVQVALFFADGP